MKTGEQDGELIDEQTYEETSFVYADRISTIQLQSALVLYRF